MSPDDKSASDAHRSPELRAAALAFDASVDAAPRIVASGAGELAREIVRRAELAGKPVLRDPALASLLSELPPGKEIPRNLYRAAAALFALVYRLDESRRSR